MYIYKVKTKNFKSIYGEFELDFEDKKGMWKITGSVGAGKTTIGEIIIFGLFGTVSGKSNGDLISWGETKSVVELWCSSCNNNIYIKREINKWGQSPIYVEINGEELVFTNKRNAQFQLESEYYDTSRVMVELLCVISFNNFKSLTTLNTNDTREFLNHILGFKILSEYNDKCNELKSINSSSIKQLENEINNFQHQINKLEEVSKMSLEEGDINEVNKFIKELDSKLDVLKKEYKDKSKNINDSISSLKEKKTKLTTLGSEVKKEIQILSKGICPICGAEIKPDIINIKNTKVAELREDYIKTDNELKSFQLKLTELTNKYNSNPIHNEIYLAKNTLLTLRNQEKYKNINLTEISSLKQKIVELENDLVKYKTDEEEWSALSDIFTNKVKTKILRSFIPVLNENISNFSQRLRLPYLVKFNDSFKCELSLYGTNSEIPLSSLSTGQLKVVDMVVILGILKALMGVSGINIIFLDELFSNLDAGLRTEMCQVIRENRKEDQTIFIISHTDLDDNYFEGDIHMRLGVGKSNKKYSSVTINKY